MEPAHVLLTRAQLLMQHRQFSKAEEQLRSLLSTYSDNARAHALLAICLVERKELSDAENEANQAIHHAPDEAFGFFAKSIVSHQKKDLAQAKTAIVEAIRLQPWESIYFARLAAIEHDAYQWQASLAAAEQGLACDPDDVECTNLRAIALVRLGRKEEAGRTIAAALAKAPDNATTHANQGWTLLQQGDAKQAMHHFRESLRLQPNNEWARRGIIEAMKARFFVYRWLLQFFLWMTRFSPRTQLLLILALVFGQQIVAEICGAIPLLSPLQIPILVIYGLFAWMTWIAPSLFNLVLFLSPFGRLVLNREEKLSAILVGSCILAGLAVGGIGHLLLPNWPSGFWVTGLLCLGLAIPVSTILRLHGWPRIAMALYSLGLAGVIAMTGAHWVSAATYAEEIIADLDEDDEVDPLQQAELDQRGSEFGRFLNYGINGIVISTWLGIGLASVSRGRH